MVGNNNDQCLERNLEFLGNPWRLKKKTWRQVWWLLGDPIPKNNLSEEALTPEVLRRASESNSWFEPILLFLRELQIPPEPPHCPTRGQRWVPWTSHLCQAIRRIRASPDLPNMETKNATEIQTPLKQIAAEYWGLGEREGKIQKSGYHLRVHT